MLGSYKEILLKGLLLFIIILIPIHCVGNQLDSVQIAPVPWIPEDTKSDTGNLLNDTITFKNLPMDGEIFIYSVLGNLVKKIEFANFSDPQGKKWDGKNEDGEYVSSGVYLWLVKSPAGVKTGKLIVIR
ncbi:MAG: hypothetical protein JW871_06170 [Endomicrobiales bacterium]|nr:hypothetical protein [Endomicrobiales bacterium]